MGHRGPGEPLADPAQRAVGVHNDKHRLTSAYHRMLVWDIMRKPAVTRLAEQALNPLIGKSLVVYAVKTESAPGRADG